MQKELTEWGLQGYQFLGISTCAGGRVSVMKRGVGEVSRRQYEYKFLATARESTTQKELSEALVGGCKFIEIGSIGQCMIVLGRIKEEKEAAAEGNKSGETVGKRDGEIARSVLGSI